MLVSSTESPLFRALGRSTTTPERYGVDALWLCRMGMVGVQRKEIADFLASVTDGRLSKEVGQMQSLDVKVLVLEGRPQWTVDGVLLNEWGQAWTKQQHRAFLWSMRMAGVWVEWSESLPDTIEVVKELEHWSKKAKHQSLMRRTGPAKGAWGKRGNRAWAIHLLEGFDGIGPTQAERILDAFDGAVPLAWTVDERELLQVPGLGKVKVQKMVDAIGVIRDVGGEVSRGVA